MKQKYQKLIKFATPILFLIILSVIGLFTYQKTHNIYILTGLFTVYFVLGIETLNKIIIKVYSLINENKNFYSHIILRGIRLPIISLLYVFSFSFLLKILGQQIPVIENYALSILKFTNYYIIIVIGWTTFRISQKIKEKQVQNFLINNRNIFDEETSATHKNKYKTTNIDTGFKLLNFVIIVLTIIAIINEATGSVSGFLALGGGLAIVFGLSARDFLSNFFGGFMIYINRPFDIGDLIKISDKNIEGTVNEIGWTAVKIMSTEKRPIYIPNSSFSNLFIENSSKMESKIIKESFKVELTEDIKNIGKACKDIKNMLEEHQGVDQDSKIIVNINSISEDYAEIILRCFSKSIEISRYHSIKQNILIKTFDILKNYNIKLQIIEKRLIIEQKTVDSKNEMS